MGRSLSLAGSVLQLPLPPMLQSGWRWGTPPPPPPAFNRQVAHEFPSKHIHTGSTNTNEGWAQHQAIKEFRVELITWKKMIFSINVVVQQIKMNLSHLHPPWRWHIEASMYANNISPTSYRINRASYMHSKVLEMSLEMTTVATMFFSHFKCNSLKSRLTCKPAPEVTSKAL